MESFEHPYRFTRYNINVVISVFGHDPEKPDYIALWDKAAKYIPAWKAVLERFIEQYRQRLSEPWSIRQKIEAPFRAATRMGPARKTFEIFIIGPEDIVKVDWTLHEGQRPRSFCVVDSKRGTAGVYLFADILDSVKAKYILLHELLHIIQQPSVREIAPAIARFAKKYADRLPEGIPEGELAGYLTALVDIICNIIVEKLRFQLIGKEYHECITGHDISLRYSRKYVTEDLCYLFGQILMRHILSKSLCGDEHRRFERVLREVKEAVPSLDIDVLFEAIDMLEDGCNRHVIEDAFLKLIKAIPPRAFLEFKKQRSRTSQLVSEL